MRTKLFSIFLTAAAAALLFGCAPKETAAVGTPNQAALSLFPGEETTRMAPGQSVTFTAIVESGTSQSRILWESDNEAVASVDEDGIVTAKAEGSARITAGMGEHTASADITVLPNVKEISTEQETLTVLTGVNEFTYLPKCTISPANSYYQGIIWTSSDESIASIGADGTLFGIAPGTCTITGISEDPACESTVSCTVTVKTGIEEITLEYKENYGYVGKTVHLDTTVYPQEADKTLISYASSDETIATVDAYGNVAFLAPGHVTISCNASDGSHASGRIELDVVKGTYALRIDQKNPTLLLGGKDTLSAIQLSCSLIPADTSFTNVEWVSDNEAVAAVSEDGLVKAQGLGKCTITAISKDPAAKGNIKDSTKITVGKAVTAITLKTPDSQLAKGHRYKIEASVFPADALNPKLKWESSDNSVLSVDNYGNIQARSAGTAAITCTATDGSGITAAKDFTVITQVERLYSDSNRLILTAGHSADWSIRVFPENADIQSLHYSSADSSVVSVSQNGKITGLREGRTTVTARTSDGSRKEIRIPVIVEPAVPLNVTSLGRTGYNGYYNEFTATFTNLTTTKTITAITFELAYTAGKDSGKNTFTAEKLHLNPGQTQELGSWKASGLNFVDSFTIYLTSVTFADGSTESFTDTTAGSFQY